MNSITKTSRTLALLIVGVGLAGVPQSNASLLFNGATSKAVLDGSYLDGKTHSTYTFELWIKPYNLATGGTLLGKNTGFWKGWQLHVTPSGGLWLGGSWPNYYWGAETAVGSITLNTWQHVCCSVTSGQASFYVNGNLVGTEAVNDPIDFLTVFPDPNAPQLDAAMSVGYGDNGTVADGDFFNGLIYGIKVWSRTLSASEVYAIATTGVAPSTSGLYNAVLLNEGSGSTIHDSLTDLTGRVLTAQWSSENPTIPLSPTSGLMAYYPFSGNANDQSMNANNGTANGAVLAADRFGQAANAFAFNGAGAYVSAPNKSYLTFPIGGDFTISIWASASGNPSASSYKQWFLCGLDNGPGPTTPKWLVQYGPMNFPNWPVQTKYVTFITTDNSGKGYWLASAPFDPPLGSWHQIVFTKQGTSYSVFIDGVSRPATNYMMQAGSGTVFTGVTGPSSISSGITAPLTIGWAEGGGYYQGKLDDLRIYNRALLASEVQQLYVVESGLCSPHKATATAVMFNEFVVDATVTDGGCGYTNAPTVLVQGGGGTGATATATVTGGQVTAVHILNAGYGFTSIPKIVIGSPPFVPTVSIAVSKVKVTQNVVLGRTYVLEASTDLLTWTATGPEFTAEAESIVSEFEVDVTGGYFRIRQVAP